MEKEYECRRDDEFALIGITQMVREIRERYACNYNPQLVEKYACIDGLCLPD